MISAQCSFCGKEMQFAEGDVIFGDKWYHKNCTKQAGVNKSEHTFLNN